MAFMPDAKSSAASAPSSSAIGFFGDGVSGVAVAGVEHIGGRGPHLLIAIRHFEGGSLVDRGGQRPVFLVQSWRRREPLRFPDDAYALS